MVSLQPGYECVSVCVGCERETSKPIKVQSKNFSFSFEVFLS